VEPLNLPADRALFDGKVQALVASCYQDERPLQGLAGLLDWRFQGMISHCLRIGVLSGRPGECAYLPLSRGGKTFHVILAGAGFVPRDKARAMLPKETIQALSANLSSLKLSQVGVSRSDLGDPAPEWFTQHWKGIPLCIVN
jgi:hypothetical protein